VNYGPAGQIGFGQTYADYLDECEAVFESVYKWTNDDGSLWLVADTLMGASTPGVPSSLIPLPFALAERATKAGWILRDVIIWRKDRTRPWTSAGRLRNAFEYVLYFVKSNQFKHHVERLRDLRNIRSWWVQYPERHNPWGMTPDNVWEIPIPVQGSWASNELRHACPFPEDLVRRMVQLSTDEGDVVFDPFSGSGMVAAVAEADSRRPLGTELSETIYRDYVRPTVLGAERFELDVDATDLTGTLLTLRALKYPKDLIRQLLRTGTPRTTIIAAFVGAEPFEMTPRSRDYGNLKCVIMVPATMSDDDIADLYLRATRAASRAPLSKYGLNVTTLVRRVTVGIEDIAEGSTLAVYLEGRTWEVGQMLAPTEQASFLSGPQAKKFPPILSPMETRQSLED
jgi:DNA modification methylase